MISSRDLAGMRKCDRCRFRLTANLGGTCTACLDELACAGSLKHYHAAAPGRRSQGPKVGRVRMVRRSPRAGRPCRDD